MKDDPHLPERTKAEDEEFQCNSCGEKFNSPAEAEQHEKDCCNRKSSGA
jgi:formylmethanofuran dehydrogenase subunit E